MANLAKHQKSHLANFPSPLSKTIRDFLPAARQASQFVTFTKSQIQSGKIPHSVLLSFERRDVKNCENKKPRPTLICDSKENFTECFEYI